MPEGGVEPTERFRDAIAGHLASKVDVRGVAQSGGRPATVYKFVARELTVTDPFAVVRPPR